MNKLFTEFENESGLRSYPFASGCTMADAQGERLGVGTLVDAVLYPVNSTGTLYLSRIGTDGTVSVSDSRTVVMTATLESGSAALEFYDLSDMHRHVGTVVASSPEALASLVNVYEDRVFTAEGAAFAASCVFPVVNDGVTSVNVGGTGAQDGTVAFANGEDDKVRVATDAYGEKLRFDVVPQAEGASLTSIQHIYCIVDGRTPFRIEKIPFGGAASGLGNVVAVYLDNITRQDICGNAHREGSLEERDTCRCDDGCSPDYDPPVEIPEAYQVEVVDMDNGAQGAFYLAAPNITGYDNPLSVTLEDGTTAPVSDIPADENADYAEILSNGVTAKGVLLQVPGLEA